MNVFAYPKVTAKKLIELGVDRVFAHAAAAWVRAADEAGFTLFEKKQIINTQAD